jgi:hypothetical protein
MHRYAAINRIEVLFFPLSWMDDQHPIPDWSYSVDVTPQWTQSLIAKIAVPPTWNGTIAGNLNSYNEDMDSL